MNKTEFCCEDFEKAVNEMVIIDENTFDHTINCNGVKLDGWYLDKRTYQQTIQNFTYEEGGAR